MIEIHVPLVLIERLKMLRFMLTFTGLVFTCGAFCQSNDPNIELISSSEDGNIYIIRDTLEYNSGTAKIWKILDFKKFNKDLVFSNGNECKSMRTQYEYKCSDRSEKMIYIKCYTKQMGYGVEFYSSYEGYKANPTVYSPSDWEAKGYDKFCKNFWEIWK